MVTEEDAQCIAKEYCQLWRYYGVETASSVIRARGRVRKGPSTPKLRSLDDVREWLGECRRCGLCQARKSIVFGDGNAQSKLLFVGEGPGAEEDARGLPFVGRAGQLLTKIIEAIGYRREDFYIANVVKCRPPQNRTPTPEEIGSCTPFLMAQVDSIRPLVIVALGSTAALFLTNSRGPISALRGKFHPLFWNPEILVMPTYHPAYLLRNPAAKRLVWEDVKLVKENVDRLSKGSA